MQDYLIIGLLVVNLIGILMLAAKSSSRQNSTDVPNLQQKIIENQAKMMREIYELKGNIEQNQRIVEYEFEQWKAGLKRLEASVLPELKTKTNESGANLFLNDRYKEIFELSAKGLTVDEIAKQLGKGSGEVSFILQLADQART